jgi:hypothetical protein
VTVMLPAPRATLDALRVRIDRVGLIEHSIGSVPDPTSGHCIDDAGRALGMANLLAADLDAEFVAAVCLRQLERSVVPGRGLVLRLDADGHPTDDPLSDDGWARTLWGLALAATGPLDVRGSAEALLDALARSHSTHHPRAAAHAVLAGLILLRDDGGSTVGAELVERHAPHLPSGDGNGAWRWPEPRLTYGDALVVEARLALDRWRRDDAALLASLDLLDWLVDLETCDDGHMSLTPVGGRGPGDPAGFDQQPIEAWTLADAARLAHDITGERRWADVVRHASAWFEGANDLGVPVWDPATGSAYDALTRGGVNLNQGAESTLAFIGTRYAAEIVASSALEASPEASRRSSRR